MRAWCVSSRTVNLHRLQLPRRSRLHSPSPVVFRIYDIKADGYIDKDELLEVIQMMVGTHVGKADLDAVVAQTFKEADSDLDGKLSFKEFRHVIEHTDIGQRLSIGF